MSTIWVKRRSRLALSSHRERRLVFLGREHLAAFVHAGLQVDVVRPAQLAGLLVLDKAVGLQSVVRAAHAGARGRDFAFGDGHGKRFFGLADIVGEAAAPSRVSAALCPKGRTYSRKRSGESSWDRGNRWPTGTPVQCWLSGTPPPRSTSIRGSWGSARTGVTNKTAGCASCRSLA